MARRSTYGAASRSRALSEIDWFVGDAVALLGWLATADSTNEYRRRRRRQRRKAMGGLFAGFVMVAFAAALVLRWAAVRIARGIAALAAVLRAQLGAPLARVSARALSVRWRGLPSPASVGAAQTVLAPSDARARSCAAALPWLERRELQLPEAARTALRSLAQRVQALSTQLQDQPVDGSERAELRRLLDEELAALIDGYCKLPTEMTKRAMAGIAHPEEQLIAGIAIIDGQLVRLQERMAGAALRALSTHVRYLALKYAADAELEVAPRVDAPSGRPFGQTS